jgi:hypothetical protein
MERRRATFACSAIRATSRGRRLVGSVKCSAPRWYVTGCSRPKVRGPREPRPLQATRRAQGASRQFRARTALMSGRIARATELRSIEARYPNQCECLARAFYRPMIASLNAGARCNFLRQQQTARLQATDPAIDRQAPRRSATHSSSPGPPIPAGTKARDLTLDVGICALVMERTLDWPASVSYLWRSCEHFRLL